MKVFYQYGESVVSPVRKYYHPYIIVSCQHTIFITKSRTCLMGDS